MDQEGAGAEAGAAETNATATQASYAYDVFLSYRRRGGWATWVQDLFLPVLEHWLGEALERDARIFRDATLDSGTKWPPALGKALGGSRVVVALISGQYFSNDWCLLEFSHMRAREHHEDIAIEDSLVVSALLHPVEDEAAADLTPFNLVEVADPWIAKGSARSELLSQEVRAWVPAIAKAIKRAPTYDPAWQTLAVEEFVKQYRKPQRRQETVPGLGSEAS